MLQKISISEKCCSSFYSSKKPEKMFFWAANQNIWMISEGWCDWSNDPENSALKSQE